MVQCVVPLQALLPTTPCLCPHLVSLSQVRVPIAELPSLVRRLTDMEVSWKDVAAKYPAQAQAAGDE